VARSPAWLLTAEQPRTDSPRRRNRGSSCCTSQPMSTEPAAGFAVLSAGISGPHPGGARSGAVASVSHPCVATAGPRSFLVSVRLAVTVKGASPVAAGGL
jgi:hypothetical protein